MKMQKVIKRDTSYPIKPIIFTAVVMVSLSGCGGNRLSPHKTIKPLPPIHISIDKNNTGSVEPVEPAIAGMMPIRELPKK